MKFVIFCEGHTERAVMSDFLSRWLNPRLREPVGFKRVRFDGWKQLVDDTPTKARMHLADPDNIAVISLLDLYGPTFYPYHLRSPDERSAWGREHLQARFQHPRFRHHFAVHEIEAWLLSEPHLLPPIIAAKLPGHATQPETVNSDRPPAKLLNQLYRQHLKRDYKKVTDGTALFKKLNPEAVYRKCPAFKALADDLLELCPPHLKRTSNPGY